MRRASLLGGDGSGGRLFTGEGIQQLGKYSKDQGNPDFHIQEGSYRYGKGENKNESCGIGLKIKVSVCTHGFQYERDIEI